MSLVWRIVLGALALTALACPARSEEPALLETTPAGAYLSIEGAVSLAGTAPLPIDALPPGEYRLWAEGPGLAAARARLVIGDFGLRRRFWAGPTAFLLPPGVAHLERGESRGWALLGAGATSATMSLVSQAAWERARNELAEARAAGQDLGAATEKEHDKQEVRNLWLAHLAVTWVGAGVEAVLFTPQPAISSPGPGRHLVTIPHASVIGAAARSLLVPGSGQRYLGHVGRANAFLMATSAFAAASIASHDTYLEARRNESAARRRYAAAEGEDARSLARHDLRNAENRADNKNIIRWIFAGAAAGAYAWNILDAFSLGHRARSSGLAWSAAPGPDGLLLCARWSAP
jgi:hypothetical protein